MNQREEQALSDEVILNPETETKAAGGRPCEKRRWRGRSVEKRGTSAMEDVRKMPEHKEVI